MSACGCFRQTAHILIVRKLISRIIEHQKTRTQNSSRRCANTNRYKYLKHKAPGMPLSTGYMIKIKQFMPVSDMYMLIYLKYARAYALLKKAFCYAQKGQICLKKCGHYGPKPILWLYVSVSYASLFLSHYLEILVWRYLLYPRLVSVATTPQNIPLIHYLSCRQPGF